MEMYVHSLHNTTHYTPAIQMWILGRLLPVMVG